MSSAGDSEGVARIMKNLGLLVDMDYGCDGSSASSEDAYDIFVENIGLPDAKERELTSSSDYDLLVN